MKLKADIMFIGFWGVGKTSLIHRYVNNEFSTTIAPTRVACSSYKEVLVEEQKVMLCLQDYSGGNHNIDSDYFISRAYCIMFCYSVENRRSFEELENWFEHAKKWMTPECLCVLVGNKSDLSSRERKVEWNEAAAYCRKNKMDLFFETSAKAGAGVQECFASVVQELVKRHDKIRTALQQAEVREKDRLIENYRRECMIYKAHIEFLNKDLEMCKSNLREKEETLENVKARSVIKTAQNASLKKEIDIIKGQSAKDQENRSIEHISEISDLKREILDFNQEITAYRSSLGDFKRLLEVSMAENSRLKQEIEGLNQAAKQKDERFHALQRDLQNYISDLRCRDAKIEALEKLMREMEASNALVRNEALMRKRDIKEVFSQFFRGGLVQFMRQGRVQEQTGPLELFSGSYFNNDRWGVGTTYHRDYVLRANYLDDSILGNSAKVQFDCELGTITIVGSLKVPFDDPRKEIVMSSFGLNKIWYNTTSDGAFEEFRYTGKGQMLLANGWSLSGFIEKNRFKWGGENKGARVSAGADTFFVRHLADPHCFVLDDSRVFCIDYRLGQLLVLNPT